MAEALVDRVIRRQGWLERVGDLLQGAVGGVYGALGRPGRALKNIMHGTTFGHPLHPAVTDVPIGAWTAGLILDVVAHYTDRVPAAAGDVALAVGLLAAVLAAATGLTDYHDTFGHERRMATAHGLTMVLVVTLDAVSMGLRWWGAASLHPPAVGLSTAGYALLLLGGYLGGHVVFGIGTAVNRNAFVEGPEDFVTVGRAEDFPEGVLKRVDAGGMAALVVRRGERLHAIGAVCSHAGGPLDEGALDGLRVTCPWHGSVFCVDSGRVRNGPATFAEPQFVVRDTDGQIELKLAAPLH
jgi:nitrite reductase/ring-hydroxylating ferredoxin subunit/uncharacterized membrane protein